MILPPLFALASIALPIATPKPTPMPMPAPTFPIAEPRATPMAGPKAIPNATFVFLSVLIAESLFMGGNAFKDVVRSIVLAFNVYPYGKTL